MSETWLFEDLKRALTVMFPGDGALVELRVIARGGGALSGIFDSGDEIASYVALHSGSAKGVYVGLNRIKQDRRGHYVNELIPDGRGVADHEIEARELLLIDIDCDREDKNAGTTDDEHDAALHLANDVKYVLSEEGWPEPLWGDSGNGAHLIYRLPSLPNDERSTLLVKDILEQLAGRFNNGKLKIDTSVFNASRISKLYGTMVCKGPDTPERPWRLARIISCPDQLEPVQLGTLDDYRKSQPVAHVPATVPSGVRLKGFTLDEFIARYNVRTRPKQDYKGDGYRWQMDCPFNPAHKAPDAALYEYGDGSKAFKCSHDSCRGKGWEDFRAQVEPGWQPFDPNKRVVDMVRMPAASVPEKPEQIEVHVRDESAVDLLLRGSPDLNDVGNAARIKSYAAGRILYSHDERSWYSWDGRRFKKSEMQANKLAQEAMAAYLMQTTGNEEQYKFAVKSLDAKRLDAALKNLRSHVSIEPSELDAKPHLLNCLNGTVDLRTGELQPHNMDDKLTKLAHVNYVPNAECPTFLGAFDRVLPGMLGHLQKCIGYSITGDTREKVVFICHGATGDNGKTTLVEAIRRVLPEYSCKIMIDSLMARTGVDNSNTQSDLSDLKGARFASTSETESGQRLSEGKIKRITQGGGIIKACRKYENTIEFSETHKLWMDCNHLPVVKGSDDAIWRRMYLIPFNVQLRKDQIDSRLSEKLDAEADGILAWMVAGAVRWYAEGLGTPDFVAQAREEWREDMDIVAPFIEARCNMAAGDEDTWVSKTSLYDSYVRWSNEQGDKRHLSREGFFEYLTAKGFNSNARARVKGKQMRVVSGISLRCIA